MASAPLSVNVGGATRQAKREERDDVRMACVGDVNDVSSMVTSNLSRVRQLTGLGETLYAEVTVTVNQFDLRLAFVIANNTEQTLQNVGLELATVGDTLRICERPPVFVLGPKEVVTPSVSIKVAATEAGVIYGQLTWGDQGQNSVALADTHIDVIDFIQPASCSATAFRTMWAEFLWENKIVVSTDVDSLRAFLQNIIANTNLRCLSEDQLEGDCDFLSANLYGRSRFGEDALVNVSIEMPPSGQIEGFIRIRSTTQGIALSLGDKITLTQKSLQPKSSATKA
eukprot:TRINITY_DN70547_c0_g1_i1.p1 TRINITY_DN70547_c0_g1~~TRINITY_DN70547_c0_g1_i1.p1  ORF type:complete len:284 (+),score=96.90 TRINITY_DN70547_c0_g1_i1:2-853(+)